MDDNTTTLLIILFICATYMFNKVLLLLRLALKVINDEKIGSEGRPIDFPQTEHLQDDN